MNPFRYTYTLPILSGILLATAFPRFHVYPLAWIALVPLLVATLQRNPRTVALHFFITGWVFHTLVLQWLMTNIFWAGGWAILGQQGLCILLSLFWAVAGYLWTVSTQYRNNGLRALILALLWAALEYAQAISFTGFGWTALGYSQGPDTYFSQLATLGGVTFLSTIIIFVNAGIAIAWTCSSCRWKALPIALVVLVLAHLPGMVLLDAAQYDDEPFQVGIVQTNYGQLMKWDRNYTVPMVEEAAELSRNINQWGAVDLFVWPEAALMSDYNYGPMMRPLNLLTTETKAHLLTGTVRRDSATNKSYNSAILVDESGTVSDYYDKVHLAPFGEYLPLEPFTSFLRFILIGSVDAGEEQKLLSTNDRNFGPLICFEVLFTPMALHLRDIGADSLVVVSNLGWFGSSNAVPQALEVARFRAIETRLPLIQAANTGISGIFDPYGRFTGIGQERNPDFNPQHLLMQKAIGRLPLAQVAAHPFPAGPVWVPRILAVLGLLLTALCWWRQDKAQVDG